MTNKPKFYELSPEADLDLEDIYDYTIKEFGMNQAVIYLTSINDALKELVKSPKIGRTRDEIREGLYCMPHMKHLIFYRILHDRIRVIRVLHGNRDIPKYFI